MANGTVIYDLIEDAEAMEEAGEFLTCNRTFTVEVPNTGRVGDAFHDAANDSRIPKCGDELSDYYPNIKCERRSCSLAGYSATGMVRVKVRCEYGLQRPSDDPLSVSGDSTLNQIKITKDRNGSYVGVTHDGEFKQVPVTVLQARHGFSIQMTEYTDDPETLRRSWINHINTDNWKGGAPKEWLVARVAYQLVNRTTDPLTYVFTYEFDCKPGGHVYAAGLYDDDGTLITQGSEIAWHPEREFTTKFGA